jgi:hypothetical protein
MVSMQNTEVILPFIDHDPGTLMAPGVLYRVIYGSATPQDWQKSLTTVRPALLQSYRRHRVKYADYPAIIPHESSSVRGSYVTGLTEGDIYRLDIFEGDMYAREKVIVNILSDKISLDQKVSEQDLQNAVVGQAEAETYVWTIGADKLEEREWDFEEFKNQKMKAWMGQAQQDGVEVDDGFADVDRAVAEEEERERHQLNGDPSGGRINGKIARALESAAL